MTEEKTSQELQKYLGKDLPEKTLLDNADVVVEISFEAETSNEINYTLVATRKDGSIQLDPGFTKINGPTTKMPKNFIKKVGPMAQEKFQELQIYLGKEYVLEYDGDKVVEKILHKKHGHKKLNKLFVS